MGYLGRNGNNYAQIGPNKDTGVTIEICYKIVGENRYLAPDTNAYLAWWLGQNGSGWVKEDDGKLRTNYGGGHLSFYSVENTYLYAWDPYTQLKIELEPA